MSLVFASEMYGAATAEALFVVHGPGRGRQTGYLSLLLDTASESRPDLRARMRIHQTGNPVPDLAGVGVVTFLLGDPLEDLYPQCYAEAVAVADQARALGIPMLNAPQSLNNTTKSRQGKFWRAAGIPCARSWSLTDSAMLREFFKTSPFPVLIRFDWGHAQQCAYVCWNRQHAAMIAPRIRFPAAALEFIDVRGAWRAAAPNDIRARYHHKKRSYVFGDRVLNGQCHFSSEPLVSNFVSTFSGRHGRRRERVFAALGMHPARLAEAIAIDKAYADAPPEAPELMRTAIAALRLDFAAIDYSTLPNGEHVLWEANPFFGLAHWSRAGLWQERELERRHRRLCAAAMEHIEGAMTR
jgi:hypothetical protein